MRQQQDLRYDFFIGETMVVVPHHRSVSNFRQVLVNIEESDVELDMY